MKDVEIEEMPMAKSRSQQLIDPAAELEVVKRQQALFMGQAQLSQLKRSDDLAKRWGLVNRLAIPAGAIVLGTATMILALLVINYVGAGFWRNTNWWAP